MFPMICRIGFRIGDKYVLVLNLFVVNIASLGRVRKLKTSDQKL